MSYDFNVPYVDFAQFDENDGADTFFDVNCQLDKLSINEDKNNENKSNNIPEIKAKDGEERKGEIDVRNTEESLVDSIVELNEDQGLLSEVGEENKKQDVKSCSTESKSDIVECNDKNGIGKIRSKKTDIPDILSEISDAAQNIKNNKKRKSDVAHGKSKFISLAESIQKFQVATPPRFHSRPKGQKGVMRNQCVIKQHVTIPQSPNLLSKARTRPVDYPTAEEREKKEVEELLSYKLEVHPIDPKIFEPPKCGKRVPKQPVVVEPFNLTEFKKKETKKSVSPFRFKAQSVPKGILQHTTGVPEKKPIPVTNPSTPLVLSKHKQKLKFMTFEMIDGKKVLTSKEAEHTGVCMDKKTSSKTEPKPFSFEERDKLMMKHKEAMIQKVYKEEKEAREFHAKPLPNYIKKLNKTLDTTISSVKSTDNEEEKKPVFRAQPAAVLHRQPFIPKLSQRTVEPVSVLLATEERAKQRAEFDAAREQHRKEIAAELQRRKELAEQQAQEEEALLRQQTIHRAQPIRSYKAVPEALKAPLTSPRSPCFSERNTRNASKQ